VAALISRMGKKLRRIIQQGVHGLRNRFARSRLDQLAGCAGPRTCPHGRPTLIVLTKHQLEYQFGRLGA